ncbi:hypothetical protein L3Q82_009343 [Scortum barcoo]|uniref:Uncharacterized protein n=1 Tax=Scortum barcoo TaxID=214431 RepID=A0ACB8WG44_9TELE|nr:hypothetical protein L3Q82_009343 [Scortum barcoo]
MVRSCGRARSLLTGTGAGQASRSPDGTVLEAKTRVWEEFGEEAMEEDYYRSASKRFWQTVRRLRRGKQYSANTVYSAGGELLTSTEDIVGRWKKYFEDLLNPTDLLLPMRKQRMGTLRWVDSSITQAEVTEVVQCKLLGGKAPGVDEIRPEYLKSLDVVGLSWLTRLCNIAWREVEGQYLWSGKLGWWWSLFLKRGGPERFMGVCPTSPHVLCGSGEGIRPCPSWWYSVGSAPVSMYGVRGPFKLKGCSVSLYDRSRSLVCALPAVSQTCSQYMLDSGRLGLPFVTDDVVLLASHQARTFSMCWSGLQPSVKCGWDENQHLQIRGHGTMVLDRKRVVCPLRVSGEVLPQVEEFKYHLGVLFTSEGKMEREIDRRIGAASSAVMRSV